MKLTPILFLLCATSLWPQNEQDIAEGKALFRSNCAFCHGMTGAGGRGPALNTGHFVHGSSDQDIKNVIRNGVPGTTMPSFESIDPDELNRLVAFIRHLAGAGESGPRVSGDAAHGRQVYLQSGCPACHRVGSEGSVYGPDLTRIGASRSAAYIGESVVKPSEDIPEEYQGVTVVTKDGRRVTGIRVNEDSFSVQLRDPSQRFRMYDKSAAREVIYEKRSLMPAYDKLAPRDLNDLLAFLSGLRGDRNAGAETRKAEGIH